MPKRSRIAIFLSLTITAAIVAPRPTCAQDAFGCIAELSDDEVQYRLERIQRELEDGKRKATRWRYGWMGAWLAIGGATTYLAVDAAREDRRWDRFGWAYLAGGAYFAALTQVSIPAPDVWGAKRIRRLEGSSEALRKEKLRYATKTLERAAEVQAFTSGASGVVVSLIYGVTGGTVKAAQWPGLSRGLSAGMYIAPPTLVALQTMTAPRAATRAYEAYRGIACSSKYYEQERDGPEIDFDVGLGGGRFRVVF